MLSGLNLDFFGAGEYPYSTVLQDTTCETIAYNLREQGYATTAMHNHTGTFYDRNEIYPRLGFEHFVSQEYMPYVTYTEVGWAEDVIAASQALGADFLGVGQALAIGGGRRWAAIRDDWPAVWQAVPVRVTVSADVGRTFDLRDGIDTSGGGT